MPALDWDRLKWYGVLTIGTGFSIAGLFIAITKDSGGWFAFLFFLFCAAMAVHELWPQLIEGKRRDPHAILRRFPGPVRLRVPRRKLVFFLASTVAFVVSILWVAVDSELSSLKTTLLWTGGVLFAAAIPVFLIMILRGPTLRLDTQGLEVFQGVKRSSSRWIDTGEFSVVDANVMAPTPYLMVAFDDAKLAQGTLASLNRSLIGHTGALPDTYGLDPYELAWLLNEWRARALQPRDVNPPPPH